MIMLIYSVVSMLVVIFCDRLCFCNSGMLCIIMLVMVNMLRIRLLMIS